MKIKVIASGSKGNCYIIEDQGKKLILDCGIPIKEIKRALDWNVTNIAGVFVSHSHKDHAYSADTLRKMGMPMFEPYKMDKDLGRSFRKDGYFMFPFNVEHDGIENCGVLIETPSKKKILYITDFEFCKYTFKGYTIETMIIECNHIDDELDEESENYSHVVRGHASLEVTKEFIRHSATDSLKSIILCHLNANADWERMVNEIREIVPNVNVFVGKSGVEIEYLEEPG